MECGGNLTSHKLVAVKYFAVEELLLLVQSNDSPVLYKHLVVGILEFLVVKTYQKPQFASGFPERL